MCDIVVTLHGKDRPGYVPITQTGVCWSTSQNPTIADSRTKLGEIFSELTRLKSNIRVAVNSTFYIRGYATTSIGTTYGNQITYTTKIDLGLVTGGGIIYYIDNSGQHGLVAAATDQGKNIPWAPPSLMNVQTKCDEQRWCS